MQTLPGVSSCSKSTMEGSGMISVFITNLGKYNEGELVGEWLAMPTTPEHMTQCLERIGIDGISYEEFFLTDYESSINGVTLCIGEYSDLNELNYLASRLEELNNHDIEIYEAVIDMGGYVQSVADLINLIDNLACFVCLCGVSDDYDLGYYWIEESGADNLDALGNLAYYFDYDKYGHDIALELGGAFYLGHYVYPTGEQFIQEYDGKDVPAAYCILATHHH